MGGPPTLFIRYRGSNEDTAVQMNIDFGPPRGHPGLNKKVIEFDTASGEMKDQHRAVAFTVPEGIMITEVAHVVVPMEGFHKIEEGGAHSELCLKGTNGEEEVYFMTDMHMTGWRFIASTAAFCPGDNIDATGKNARGGGWHEIGEMDLRQVFGVVVGVIKGNAYSGTSFNCWKYVKVLLDGLGAPAETFNGVDDSIRSTFQRYYASSKIQNSVKPLVNELFEVKVQEADRFKTVNSRLLRVNTA